MKKVIYTAMAACAISLAACGGAEGEANEDPYASTSAEEDAKTLCDCIERQISGDAVQEECDKLAETFEKKYENSLDGLTYSLATAGCVMGAATGGMVEVMGDVAEAMGDTAAANQLDAAGDSLDAALDEVGM